MSSAVKLASFIPGRGRWRVPEIRDDQVRATALACQLERVDGIRRARANPLTSSVLLTFDRRLSRAHVERVLTRSLARRRRPAARPKPSGKVRSTLRRLLDRNRHHHGTLAKFLAISGLHHTLECLMPALAGLVVDAIANPKTSPLARLGVARAPQQVLAIGVAGLGLWSTKSWALGVEQRLSNELAQNIQHELRVAVYGHLQTLDMEHLTQSRTGALSSTLDTDVEAIESLLDNGVAPLVRLGANVVTAAWGFATLSPSLGMLQVLAVPALVWGSVRFVKPARAKFSRSRGIKAELSSALVSNMEALTTIRSFGSEDREKARIARESGRYRDADLDAKKFVAMAEPRLDVGAGLGFLLTLMVGGRQVLAGKLSPGVLSTLSGMSLRLLTSLTDLGVAVGHLQRDLAAFDRVFEVLDTHPRVRQGTRAVSVADTRGHLRYRDVAFGYQRGPRVLRGIDLEARAGQTTAIVGSTGAGKSSLLRLLLRFYDRQGGSITLNGVDIEAMSAPQLRRSIAYVSQEGVLFPGTVRENIAYGRPGANQAQIEHAAQLAAASEFIAGLPQGYDTMVGERGANLSGGQRQRLAIARALLMDAPIVILDEATSAVDNETERAIQRSLAEGTAGKTRIVVAHRLSTVRNADQIYVVHEGRVVERGQHDQLVAARGLYAGFWKVQTGQP